MANSPGQPENFEFPGEFIPSPTSQDCSKQAGGWGIAMNDFEYIWYANAGEGDYPEDACRPYYHKKAQIDALQVNNTLSGSGDSGQGSLIINALTINGGTINATSGVNGVVKSFNIPHPTKEGKRLWHGCLEGPEYGVYVRGHLKDTNVIELPDYWSGLVDPESITVSLTQIGSSQDLIVDGIDWGRRVKVRSGNGTNINCYYIINAMRKDIPALEVEQDA